MANIRYAVVAANGDIVNVVVVNDQGTDWNPPEGHSVIPSDDYDIGGTYIDSVYTPPTYPEPEE